MSFSVPNEKMLTYSARLKSGTVYAGKPDLPNFSSFTEIRSDPHVADLDFTVDEYDKIEKALSEAHKDVLKKICDKLLKSEETALVGPANKPGSAVVQELVENAEFLSPDDFYTKPKPLSNIDSDYLAKVFNGTLATGGISNTAGGRTLGDNGRLIIDECGEVKPHFWNNLKTNNDLGYNMTGHVISTKVIVSGS